MSKLRANQLTDKASTGAPTAPNGLVVTGVTTSTSYVGSGANLTALNAGNVSSGTLPTTRGGTGLTSLGSAGQALKVNSGANGLEFGTIAQKIVEIKTVRHTTSTSFNVGSTNLASANVFYFPYTSAAMLEISYARTSASNAIILQGHYSINTTSNSHAMYAFVAEDSSIRKNLAIDEHNAKREYLNVAFFCMFTAAELGSTISARTFTVSIGAGNNRTHTGVRSPNLNSSYSDTSNAPHYSEMTLMEVVAS